jgi:hypothetical protein
MAETTNTTNPSVFDAAWGALQHSDLVEIKAVRRKLSMHELRTLFQVVVPLVSSAASAASIDKIALLSFSLTALADAADDVGVKFFDTDTMDPLVEKMQAATQNARAALAEGRKRHG